MKIRIEKYGLQITAPAKLNLFLEICSKRLDGFHEVETVMCKWSLADRLFFASSVNDNINLTVTTHQSLAKTLVPSDENNLIVKALRLMRDVADKSVGAIVKLFKVIPSEAGLGGASSNAAAAIVAANQLWELNWPLAKLHSIAAEIGSDVAFFLGSNFAQCTGKGEKVYNLNYPCRLNLVVVKPPIGMSTARIYSRCVPPQQPINSKAILKGLRTGNALEIGKHMFNRLEQFAETEDQQIARLRTEFGNTNCVGHQLTGSGSCYFGIYPNVKSMRAAARQLSNRLPNMNVITGHTLSSRNIVGSFDR